MIRSFKHRGLKRFYERDDRSGIRPDFRDTIQEILTVLDDAAAPGEVDLPGYRLHPLKGGRRGEWSVWVTANFRLTFRVDAEHVTDIDLEDYH